MAERPREARLLQAPAPHSRTSLSTPVLAWIVAASLVPALAWGIALFGLPAALVCGTAVVAAVLAEALTTIPFGRFTLADGSAVLTGLLVGMFMPAGVPLGIPAAASFFGIVVVKQTFGGLGRHWMNPAVGGVLFALVSWSVSMTRWVALPGGLAVPPLESLRAALAAGTSAGGPLSALNAGGYVFSAVDAAVVGWVNAHLPSFLGAGLQRGSFDVLVGIVVGPTGAGSAPLLAAGAVLLASRGIIRWEIPVAYLGVFVILVLLLGGPAAGRPLHPGGALFQLLSGSLILGAFYAATDPVTSPLVRTGRWAYGVALGALTFLLRSFGSVGDGVVASIALGNTLVPLIDRATVPSRPGARGRARPELPPGGAA